MSAEAIRWALRYHWQTIGLETNRTWNDQRADTEWQAPNFPGWDADNPGETFIDDDVLGFMLAQGAKAEGSDPPADADASSKKKGAKNKGTIEKRRGALEVTRALSLTPFAGDITFNARNGEKGRTSLYGTEVHATRYQYGFSITPGYLREGKRILAVIDGLVSLGEVAGNHSRFHYDFSPDALVLRWTHDPAPRLLYCFAESMEPLAVPDLVRRVVAGDIEPGELVVGGALAQTDDGRALRERGAMVVDGVKAAADEAKKRINRVLAD